MIEEIYDAIVLKVRETLESGLSIAITGWRDSNHSRFTRQLSAEKVIFLNSLPPTLHERVGLVLMTRFMDHTVFKRIRRTKLIHPVPIGTGQIKDILESCSDLLIPVPCSSTVRNVPEGMTTGKATEVVAVQDYDYDVLDFLTTPKKEHYAMSNMDQFAEEFLKVAAANAEGYVGKKILAKIRKESLVVEKSRTLVQAGWIVPGVRPGKKQISYYTAGKKILAASADPKFEPEDPIERAKFLIAQKDALLTQKNEMEYNLKQVYQKLEKILTAEKLFDQLKALVEPL